MINLKRRLYGWSTCSAEIYRACYEMFGGSVNVHPDVLDYATQKTGKKLAYYHKRVKGNVVAAYPVVDDKDIGVNLWSRYPFSYDEVLFPLDKTKRFLLPESGNRISPLMKECLLNVNYTLARKKTICLVKESFSSRTHKNRRNEYRKFLAAGGKCIDQVQFTAEELVDIYIKLFNDRFKNKVRCYGREELKDTITSLRHLMFGYVLFVGEEPSAFDLVFSAESSGMIYFDVPNGGVNPKHSALSTGSLLMWKNIESAKRYAEERNKIMHFSIGSLEAEWDYKRRWANVMKTGKVVI
ncbi:GNAT family N-acetyltransferase [Erwinia sp. S43]|uniref:GNAT family N-acetyltransferase n=1 Tax=Erwinia sp. S43 TaxID=2769339 RepID=UPI001909B142|nr:GNAT family N-acetyltransferase [Erwinia sp. S43]MBK0033193.1 GNAT family N-acetyltransferase [Erwinia sp. S43]